MSSRSSPLKLAVVQATPVFLDKAATVEKACAAIRQAAAAGAGLVAFPESFIPAYPDWIWAVPPGEEGLLSELYAEYYENSLEVPGPETRLLGQAAREAGVYVAIGITERGRGSTSLYGSLLYLDPNGSVLGCHRKLVATGGERLVWAQGDGSTLQVFDSPLGKLGGLICWENYMPLARFALYAWGVQIYLAPTWDRGEPWLATLRHIAREGRVYVLSACMPLRKQDIPNRFTFKKYYPASTDWINVGNSAIVTPEGELAAGPLNQQEGFLYADLEPGRLAGSHWMLDVTGHYGRPDVFQLSVDRSPHPTIQEARLASPPDSSSPLPPLSPL
jgi:nitrilase